MNIEVDTLLAYGATSKKWIKGEQIFTQGNEARYYHQIAEGSVKMTTSANLSKEFIQGLFFKGNSFGEPALMIGKPYPASAYAETDSLIYRLSKEKFLILLEDHPSYYKNLFLQLVPPRLQVIQQALSTNDLQTIKNMVHLMQPQLLHAGLMEHADLFASFEHYNENTKREEWLESTKLFCEIVETKLKQME
mgnify:CR=1 FL=1